MNLNWIETDRFYNSLNKEDQIDFLVNFMKFGHDNGKRITKSGRLFGETKYCPVCNTTRVTNCIACGCGSCYTCNHRFLCNLTLYDSIIEMR